ncbi:hypothetical protein VTO42DRAFT_4407 [Malbranchea cinnamomea]
MSFSCFAEPVAAVVFLPFVDMANGTGVQTRASRYWKSKKKNPQSHYGALASFLLQRFSSHLQNLPGEDPEQLLFCNGALAKQSL